MRVDKQLAVFLENRPGTLAQLCAALAERDINILALTVSDTVDHAVVRLVLDRPAEALHTLGDAGMLVVETDVLIIEVPNRPGSLAGIADRLAEHDLNIEYAYCTAGADHDSGTLVVRTTDPEGALAALQKD